MGILKGRLKVRPILCSAIVVVLTAVCICVLSAGPGDAEVVRSHSGQYILSRDAVRIITPAVIRDRNLTLRWDLQEYIAEAGSKVRSGLVSVAVVNPRTGDILALYGRDADGENCSLALNTYLSASLFKVVTATAAVDYAGMNINSTCSYNGNAHTLYRGQVTDKRDRWTSEATLAEAFASSNNVIFGKIGALKLGETPLLLTAMRLGFWKSPVVDCECTPSTVFIPESEFNLAELASGYNRYTRMSAVHAAQMVTAVVNDGLMIRPRVMTGSYTCSEQVISRETAAEIRTMMCQTVRKGTVSRAFWDSRTDPVLRA
jgi:cell division protein FtsI/penicillin-binding protein 2